MVPKWLLRWPKLCSPTTSSSPGEGDFYLLPQVREVAPQWGFLILWQPFSCNGFHVTLEGPTWRLWIWWSLPPPYSHPTSFAGSTTSPPFPHAFIHCSASESGQLLRVVRGNHSAAEHQRRNAASTVSADADKLPVLEQFWSSSGNCKYILWHVGNTQRWQFTGGEPLGCKLMHSYEKMF